MHKYRTHNCTALSENDKGKQVKLSGWIDRSRDHGNLLFIDLRDHYGITQLVFDDSNKELTKEARKLKNESVVTIEGKVVLRSEETINSDLTTGKIEVVVEKFIIESESDILPFPVNGIYDIPEEMRLKHRFLDLRRQVIHNNIVLRSKVITKIRELMNDAGFLELQSPILTASSPEGARDFLVASRLHPGKFYALPQAPQQFKQLYMVSGFDKYYQIAPCFRDEDSRADRSPGEFYQLDLEMSFVTEEDVFNMIEPVIYNLFKSFTNNKISTYPFRRISYQESMLKYGTDKPDLRISTEISDVTEAFRNSNFSLFSNAIKKGAIVRAVPAKGVISKPRSFYDGMIEYAINEGAKGLGYIYFDDNGSPKGPIAKFLSEDEINKIKDITAITKEDAVFLSCSDIKQAEYISGKVRVKLAEELNLIDDNRFEFCWIVDFPYYEWDQDRKSIDFSHNPFSMPKGGLDILLNSKTKEELLDITAMQYDIVCNGIELSSGAIRNHKPEIMYKAFEIAGYDKSDVDEKFGGIINSFKYGAPPHGGLAPGIDRIVMLLAGVNNIREVTAFPLSQKAEDLLMNAPSEVSEKQLKDIHIKLDISKKE